MGQNCEKRKKLPDTFDTNLDPQIKNALMCKRPADREKMCNAINSTLSSKCTQEYLKELTMLRKQQDIRNAPRPNILQEKHKRYNVYLKKIERLSVDHRNKIIEQINENCKNGSEDCDFILSYEDKCYGIEPSNIREIKNANTDYCSALINAKKESKKVLTEFKRKVRKSKRKVRKSR